MVNFGTNIQYKTEKKAMPPKTTLWPLEDHTRGKHEVLKNYMDAWLPIMRRWNERVLFIDAFAGPGEYEGGEDGSPVIALKSLINHSARQSMRGAITYMFIEKDPERKKHLDDVIKQMKDEIPDNCDILSYSATFDEKLTEVLDKIDEQKRRLAPAFVMIDPFGVSDTPMTVIRRILANPKTEVYISFMYEAINRFREEPHLAPHFDNLFGCPDWRRGLEIADGTLRKDYFYGLYKDCLKNAGAKYVLQFELYRDERLIYAIFFATQHEKGCDVMKRAMWKTAPFGDFKFKSGTAHQLTLGIEPADFTTLREALHTEFGQNRWVTIEEVEKFTMTDKTEFHTGHLKQKTLSPMEKDGEIEVRSSNPKRRRGSYKEGTRLRFIRPS